MTESSQTATSIPITDINVEFKKHDLCSLGDEISVPEVVGRGLYGAHAQRGQRRETARPPDLVPTAELIAAANSALHRQ